ncbi:alginate O-acetyltransferase complex protein AlgI [Bacillus ectoiniformans]|uniref:MBOAT family O-acyltransferase n=1 Tax=Bacillus ectoiniformans TaxID=1494429 RepID=UPI00195B8B71|nr:MBOAT family protein [Bacillus ectoiniformans]MBM7649326.1 alginate O-acetyltransferase complex protein AlgI [Bacillus ectoiniformans]
MLFNSFEFIFLFLPIVLVVYFILAGKHKHHLSIFWLVAASLFFYSWWNPIYSILIIGSMAFNYGIGKWMNRIEDEPFRKKLLIFGIVGNVGLLGYFKYADFFIKNINFAFDANISLLHLMLPLAISFFTFQQIAYLVDTYRHETKEYNFLTYSLFVTFFPQLIAGPIVHHKEMMPQFAADDNKRLNIENVALGCYIFIIGLAKKVAIADTMAIWANDGFQSYTALTSAEAWITSLAYTMQLYFDFSGYCDMAIGIALLFNIKLPINFNSPYKSRNIQDFWRRWHMTLGRFLTQYIYIPLGGNRKGEMRTYFNIFAIFAISGFWHGAGWTFIIWGVMHGVASIICRAWGKLNIQLPYLVSWFITFQFVNVAWVFFRAETVGQAVVILKKMFIFDFSSVTQLAQKPLPFQTATSFDFGWFTMNDPIVVLLFIGFFLFMSFVYKNSIEMLEGFQPKWTTVAWAQLAILFVLISVFYLHKNSEFLYFNF